MYNNRKNKTTKWFKLNFEVIENDEIFGSYKMIKYGTSICQL